MDSRLIGRLRQGQADADDRRLAAALVERGLLAGDEAEALLAQGPGLRDRLREPRLLERCAGELRTGDVPEEARSAADDLSRRVGPYVLVRELGRGGMSRVWKAWDLRLRRWAALKFLLDAADLDRLRREAGCLARLDHRGVVRVYDVAPDAVRPYLALEYVDGPSLEGAALDRPRAARVVRDAARAVAHAHAHGILHRDLKPSNLLEASDGRIVVTDFGLARDIDRTALTCSGAVLGTPSFMAPEQAVGERATPATDVFGLGATLYAFLEGRPLYEAETRAQAVARAAAGLIDPPRRLDALSDVVRKALERVPSDRYASAEAMADDLDRFLEGRAVVGRPVAPSVRAWRALRRRAWAAAAAGALALGAAGAGAAAWNRTAAGRDAEVLLDRARRVRGDLRALGDADADLTNAALLDLVASTSAAADLAPGHAPALAEHGISLYLLGRTADAEAFLDRAIERDPVHAEARLYRALCRFHRAGPPFPELIAEGDAARVVLPADPGLLRRLEPAIADLDVVPPGHPELPMARAFIAMAAGRPGAAAEALREALERAPYRLEAREMLARAELLRGDAAAAEREASRCLASGRREADVWALRAYAKAVDGRLPEAVADACEALQRRPGWGTLRAFVAVWQTKLGRHRQAVEQYDLALAECPDRLEWRLGRSLARLGAADLAGAEADARHAVRLAPDDPEAQLRLGLAAQDDATAVGAFDRVLALQPSRADAHAWRGNRHVRQGRFKAALDDYQAAVRLEPGDPAWRLLLAAGQLLSGDADAAEETYSGILDAWPRTAEAFAGRGRTRFMKGRRAEAARDLERAEALKPALAAELAELLEACRLSGK